MQTLNTLSTPEEKLAALCKKYAELVSDSPSPFSGTFPAFLCEVSRLPGVGVDWVQDQVSGLVPVSPF